MQAVEWRPHIAWVGIVLAALLLTWRSATREAPAVAIAYVESNDRPTPNPITVPDLPPSHSANAKRLLVGEWQSDKTDFEFTESSYMMLNKDLGGGGAGGDYWWVDETTIEGHLSYDVMFAGDDVLVLTDPWGGKDRLRRVRERQ
jgi:hypothetical protein